MFSGIVMRRGTIVAVERDRGGVRLRIAREPDDIEHATIGDSIAIDGACLTVTRVDGEELTFDVVPETLTRTSLAQRAAGDVVNLEYALRVGDRVGGHFVYGHVDATARILSVVDEGQGRRMCIERPQELAFALVEKAFVALDGVSLTIASVDDASLAVALVPETLARTHFAARRAGERVNVEIDPLARYARGALDALRS